ncbi:hypothetical protein B0J11DRAFT_513106 [Dendryphion nanum]|uniref:Uncharacterized protein n=1 Tax=Dendryphion nanum TaxID=256645 RepID=A0A9P9I5P3_9PLEO|nr:hypothetical protein B0J11DRAFT_513106 [Dendryphion nanum]
MTNSKVIKRPNRQVTRRLDGLASKLLQYGELDGIEVVFIARNTKRDETYSYLSSRGINWLGRIEKMRSHPKAKNDFPEHVRERLGKLAKSTRGVQNKKSKNPNAVASEPEEAILVLPTGLASFPAFPEFNLTILKRKLKEDTDI